MRCSIPAVSDPLHVHGRISVKRDEASSIVLRTGWHIVQAVEQKQKWQVVETSRNRTARTYVECCA